MTVRIGMEYTKGTEGGKEGRKLPAAYTRVFKDS